jgi:hypothetical protein
MQVGESARAVLRLGCGVLSAAALAGAWETLASQAPGSPLYIGMLPGPIELLRDAAFEFGVLYVVGGLLLAERRLSKRWVWALYAGSVLTLGAGVYAALTGMHGIQAHDLRPDAIYVFVVKYTGRLLCCAGLLAIARRALGPRGRLDRGVAHH